MILKTKRKMEHYSSKFRTLLRRVAKEWMVERKDEEELCFTSSALGIITEEGEQFWTYEELIAEEEEVPQVDLVQRCLADLEGTLEPHNTFPSYLNKPDETRIRHLAKNMAKASFSGKSVTRRLETYYYMGQVLTSRGWLEEDLGLLIKILGRRKTAYTRTVAQRTYRLFSARGLAHLYAATFIRPTHLLTLTKSDFFRRLLPAARKMQKEELVLRVRRSSPKGRE